MYEICIEMNVEWHAIYVWDMYIDACYIYMWDIYRWMACNVCMRYIYCECILACNVCMRYVCCKMANMQSETLIIIDPKIFQLNLGLGSPLEQ